MAALTTLTQALQVLIFLDGRHHARAFFAPHQPCRWSISRACVEHVVPDECVAGEKVFASTPSIHAMGKPNWFAYRAYGGAGGRVEGWPCMSKLLTGRGSVYQLMEGMRSAPTRALLSRRPHQRCFQPSPKLVFLVVPHQLCLGVHRLARTPSCASAPAHYGRPVTRKDHNLRARPGIQVVLGCVRAGHTQHPGYSVPKIPLLAVPATGPSGSTHSDPTAKAGRRVGHQAQTGAYSASPPCRGEGDCRAPPLRPSISPLPCTTPLIHPPTPESRHGRGVRACLTHRSVHKQENMPPPLASGGSVVASEFTGDSSVP